MFAVCKFLLLDLKSRLNPTIFPRWGGQGGSTTLTGARGWEIDAFVFKLRAEKLGVLIFLSPKNGNSRMPMSHKVVTLERSCVPLSVFRHMYTCTTTAPDGKAKTAKSNTCLEEAGQGH